MENNEEYIDFWVSFSEIRKNLKKIILICSATVLLALIMTLLITPKYTAETTILPSLDESRGGKMGKIANIAGLTSGESQNREGLFGKIVESDQVLLRVIEQNWHNPNTKTKQKLHTILEVETTGPSGNMTYEEEQDFIEYLRDNVITFSRDKLNGFMTLRATVPRHPRLAADIANYLAGTIDLFVRESQTKKEQKQLFFSTQQAELAASDLAYAEDKLSDFRKRNVSWMQSPELTVQHSRLIREIEALSAIWISMRKQQELDKAELLNDQPAVIVLDAATMPTTKSSPHLMLNLLVGAIVGAMLSLLCVFGLSKDKKTQISDG